MNACCAVARVVSTLWQRREISSASRRENTAWGGGFGCRMKLRPGQLLGKQLRSIGNLAALGALVLVAREDKSYRSIGRPFCMTKPT